MAYEREDVLRRQQVAVSSFATKVYGWMSAGLALTAVVAYWIWSSGLYQVLMPYWWLCAIGTLAIAFVISARVNTLTVPGMAALFLGYALIQGVFFGVALPGYAAAYGGGVIWSAFATASGVFLLAMLYGVFTRNDLTSIGRILTFGLIGLIGVTLLMVILSFFMNITWLNLVISWIGLVIFVGLTAYDAQQIRAMSRQAGSDSLQAYKLALVMALRMYINVIMIFWYLLQIFSSSRR